jgi:TorA maturation chaperone TorD
MSDLGAEQPVPVTLEPEDLARANLYGLVSRLFYGPADPNLLAEVSHSPFAEDVAEGGEGLIAAWRNVREACRNAYPTVVRQEYDGLFIGVGRAAVTPYLSAYAEPSSPDRYVVRLREQLAAWGLARRERVYEMEDHVSGASDVMRWLIEAGRSLDEQHGFFEAFVYPGAVPFLVAVQKAPSGTFYQCVAEFSLAFIVLEKAAFDMDQ